MGRRELVLQKHPLASIWVETPRAKKKSLLALWQGKEISPFAPRAYGEDVPTPLRTECEIQKRWANLQRELKCRDAIPAAAAKVVELQSQMKGLNPRSLEYKLYHANLRNLYINNGFCKVLPGDRWVWTDAAVSVGLSGPI